MAPVASSLPPSYAATLQEIKTHLRSARVRAILAANPIVIEAYWQTGKIILARQQEAAWGAKVIDRLAADLQAEFPDMNGLTTRNLLSMKIFAREFPDGPIAKQPVSQLPWGQIIRLLQMVKDPSAREFYIRQCLREGWSRSILEIQIRNQLHLRAGKAQNNFALTMPPADSDMAAQLFRDPYLFDFLGTADPRHEAEVEQALVDHIQKFLLELGTGFAFVGRQVPLEVGGEDYPLDLLFYHLKPKTTATKEKARHALVPKLRFPGFSEPWACEPLSKVLKEHKLKNTDGRDVFSVSMEYGIVNQIELLGRSFAAADTSHYTIGRRYDVVYTKSPLKAFPFGIVKQCKFDGEVALSPLYGVFTPPNPHLGLMIEAYFESPNRSKDFLSPLCQKGAKNTLQITNTTFLSGRLPLPTQPAEQQKIAACLSSVDELMAAQARKVAALKTHKKGLMQQLFPREGETQPRLRFPEFQNAGEWEEQPLGKVAENLDNRRVPITSGDRKAGDVPYYGASGTSEEAVTMEKE